MALLGHLLEFPGNPVRNSHVDALLIKEFTGQVLSIQEQADFDITNLLKSCIWFRSVASDSININAATLTKPLMQVRRTRRHGWMALLHCPYLLPLWELSID